MTRKRAPAVASGGLEEAGRASSDSSIARGPSPASIRAEVVECLWTVATETLHLENWTTTPTVLDCVGDLDGALQEFQDTGRADSINEAMFVLAWAVAEADGRLAA